MGNIHSFGKWLQMRRRSRDLTQVELAGLAGCAVGTLRNIEADDARPSKQLAARLARALGVAEADLDAVVAFARGRGSAPSMASSTPHMPRTSAQSARSMIPAQLTYLIGRTEEVATLCALLLRPDVRLVTLTGPGGTGKTRVAVEVARQLVDAFDDGVAFVDLSTIADPELVLATIAQTVGLNASGGQPLRQHLATALRERAMLLLLDNFEQVAAAAPVVVELLGACPSLKMLVTSRIALGAAGEHEWPVPPLALPNLAALPPFEQLSQYESVRLFDERAREANPQFAITSGNAPAVAQICYQLDGLPLAIELAAARIKLFAPQALLARLDRRLDFLTGGGRARPTRQQTIRNTIDWSYQLLAPNEQRLFERLSMFVSGATFAAIEAVCGENGRGGDMLDDVATLTNHSLLWRLPFAPDVADPDANPRFGMLETIREFALERLGAGPEASSIRERHAGYYAALAEALVAEWDTPRIHQAIGRQRREHDNMRAALQWAVETENGHLGLRLAVALWGFWRSYGSIAEGRSWFDQLLRLDDHTTDPDVLHVRRRALHAAAWLASDQHDFVAAGQLFERSAALRQASGETEGETDLLINAARQARMQGDYQRSTALLEHALSRHNMVGEHAPIGGHSPGLTFDELGQVYRELGLVLREQGDFARATAQLEAGLSLCQVNGDRVSAALASLGLGDVARDQGDGAGVRTHCEPVLKLFREFDMHWAIGFALNTLALGASAEGDLARADALIGESETVFRDLGADASLAEVLITRSAIAQLRGAFAVAEQAARESLRLARAGAPRLFVAAGLEALGSVLITRNQAEHTARLLAAAEALRMQMGVPVRPVDQAAREQALVGARSILGDAAFAEQWAQAQKLTLEQILGSLPDTTPSDRSAR